MYVFGLVLWLGDVMNVAAVRSQVSLNGLQLCSIVRGSVYIGFDVVRHHRDVLVIDFADHLTR